MPPSARFLRLHPARLAIALLLAAVPIQLAAAVEPAPPTGLAAGTAMVCSAEQSIGFRWVKGGWKSTDFIPNRYLIEKRAAAQARDRACRDMAPGVVRDRENRTASLLGCYAIRREGDGEGKEREQVCLERWRSAGGRWVLDEVACDAFRFRPDGWFHRSSLHGDLVADPADGGKEPLSVSVGHCRRR